MRQVSPIGSTQSLPYPCDRVSWPGQLRDRLCQASLRHGRVNKSENWEGVEKDEQPRACTRLIARHNPLIPEHTVFHDPLSSRCKYTLQLVLLPQD